MGRTVPSYRMTLEREIGKWKSFMKALRASDRVAFEDLMNSCRCYASAAGAATRPIISEAMFMSILLSHQKTLSEIEDAIQKFQPEIQRE